MAASSRSRQRGSGARDSRHQDERIKKVGEVPSMNPANQPWMPSAYTAFKVILSARLCAAIWSNISDCDEVFNYWEPMHYLMHGEGFQTWEYSPVYAIRSYGYLWLNLLPLKMYSAILQANKILQFYFLRCVMAFVCSLCELYFYKGISAHFGANTSRLSLCFLIFSTGMFISCSAFLPSSFAMYLTMTAMAGWFLGHYPVAIFSVAAAAIIGWPFAGALGIPIAWHLVFEKRQIWMFIKWSLVSLLVCIVPLIQIDSHYYGGLVIAPLNIVLYNVFSEHGPNIYGVEPWHFYFLNGFLNFNIIFLLAFVALPIVVVVRYILKQPTRGISVVLALAPMYIWILVFFTRPHKEERFLFPIYPLFALSAALCLDHIQKLWSYLFGRSTAQHYTDSSNWLSILCSIVFIFLSISRSYSLYQSYHAPLDVYGDLTKVANDPMIHTIPADKDINVCVGREWYRFPSSFFLPDHKWHLQFIKSEFRGQLPKPYGRGSGATRKVPSHMNDQNLEEPSRYIDINKCHYLIDLDVETESTYEPRYSQMSQNWTVVASAQFLDTSRSHRLLRAFYVPYFSDLYCYYIDYNLLKTTRTKKSTKT